MSKPWYKKAEFSDTCARCDEKLFGHAVRMLELDRRDWTFHDRRDVPEDKSQGWHPFGLKCAKKVLLEIKNKSGPCVVL